MPAIILRIINPRIILSMIISIVGENVEAHATVHLQEICFIAP